MRRQRKIKLFRTVLQICFKFLFSQRHNFSVRSEARSEAECRQGPDLYSTPLRCVPHYEWAELLPNTKCGENHA